MSRVIRVCDLFFIEIIIHKKKLVLHRILPVRPIVRSGAGNVIVWYFAVFELLMQVFVHTVEEVFGTAVNNERKGVRG